MTDFQTGGVILSDGFHEKQSLRLTQANRQLMKELEEAMTKQGHFLADWAVVAERIESFLDSGDCGCDRSKEFLIELLKDMKHG